MNRISIKHLLAVSLTLALATTAAAYTVEWAILPQDMRLHFLRPGYYIFTYNDEPLSGIFNANGELIFSSTGDNYPAYLGDDITYLVTDRNAGHEIIGLLNRQQQLVRVPPGLFMKGDYFTDGDIISVQDKSGRVGYMDLNGKMVVNCQFLDGKPFRDGFALVTDYDGTMKYIHKDWDKTHKALKISGGEITQGKQFLHGYTYVLQKGKWQRIDSLGKKRPHPSHLNYDSDASCFDERYIHGYEKDQNPEKYESKIIANPGNIQIDHSAEGLIGYKIDGNLFIPYQFSKFDFQFYNKDAFNSTAQNFDGDYVVVAQHIADDYTLMGLLHKIDGDFTPLAADSVLHRGSHDIFKASFNYPTTLDASKLRVMIIGANDEPVPATSQEFNADGVCHFTYQPTADELATSGEDLELTYQVYADHDLLLWEDVRVVNVVDAKKITVSGIHQARTTASGKQRVWTNVNNPDGNASLTATFSITDMQGNELGTTTQTVPPGTNKRLALSIPVGRSFKALATVTLSNSQSPTTRELTMTPYNPKLKEHTKKRHVEQNADNKMGAKEFRELFDIKK